MAVKKKAESQKKTDNKSEQDIKKTSSTKVKKKSSKEDSAKIKKSRDKEIDSIVPTNTKIKTTNMRNKKKYYTHDGHELTIREHRFIDEYIATGNGRQSVIQAGYPSKAPGTYANQLLNKRYIANEIEYLMAQEHSTRIATGEQVMQFFTQVMNGEIKDQFGLDAPLGERIKAGQELAKRTVDIATKVAGVTQGQNEVTIKLDWSRRRDV